MVISERVALEARSALNIIPNRYVVDLETSKYCSEGDRTGIVCWGFDNLKDLWWVRRNESKRIEYYDSVQAFRSWTNVDLIELIRKRYFNPDKCRKGEQWFNSL